MARLLEEQRHLGSALMGECCFRFRKAARPMHTEQLCKEMPLSALLAVRVDASLPSSALICFLGVHFRLQLHFGAAVDFQLVRADKRPSKRAVSAGFEKEDLCLLYGVRNMSIFGCFGIVLRIFVPTAPPKSRDQKSTATTTDKQSPIMSASDAEMRCKSPFLPEGHLGVCRCCAFFKSCCTAVGISPGASWVCGYG